VLCLPVTSAELVVCSAFHRKCIDPWLTKTKHTCPLCKKKVFRRVSTADDSSSDGSSDETSSTGVSERTPLLVSQAVSSASSLSARSTQRLFFL